MFYPLKSKKGIDFDHFGLKQGKFVDSWLEMAMFFFYKKIPIYYFSCLEKYILIFEVFPIQPT